MLRKALDWFVFFTIFMLFCTIFSPSFLQAVEVDPGRASSFSVNLPEVAQAGTPFQVSIKVLDAEGNTVANYAELDRTVDLNVVGTGELSQDTVSSRDFSEGVLTLQLQYSVAEEIQLEVEERNHVASGVSEEMLVRPGSPTGFQILTPEEARAGEPFSIELIAEDRFGNRVTNYDETTNGLVIETDGVNSPSPSFLSVSDFRRGRLQAQLTYEVSEKVRFTVIDEVNSIREQSRPVDIQPGPLREFKVSVPNSATAGEPFQAAIEARDPFGNIVTDYPQTGRGVSIIADGEGDLAPTYLAPEEFSDGVAFTEFIYTKTDSLRILAQDRSASAEGRSQQIEMQAGTPTELILDAPDEVEAGQEFEVQVEVQDRFGNRVHRFGQMDQAVQVQITGFPENQTKISPGQFDAGRAQITLQQQQAGSVRVEASILDSAQDVGGQSNQIVVIPASPGQIKINSPNQATAGNNFSATLELQDEYGNTIRNTAKRVGKIFVGIIDHGAQSEKSFRVSKMIKGNYDISFSHEKAQEISLFAEYRRHDIRVQGNPIQITPGPFDHFAVRTPGKVQAGQSFTIGLQMRDQFGNPLQTMPANLAPLHLSSTGSDNLDPLTVTQLEMSVPNFTISGRYYISESMAVRIKDRTGRQVGISPPVRVAPGKLASFQIDLPDQARATKTFPARLEAVDRYNNVITDLNEREGEVVIASNGSDDVSPGVVSYSQFVNGVAELEFDYRTAETIRLKLQSEGIETESSKLEIVPGPPETMEVAMKNRVVAGEPFPGIIEVFDKFNNRITNLPQDFHGVRLQSSGSHRVSPGQVDRSMFEDGRAEIYMAYPRSGRLDVSARPLNNPIDPPIVERFFVERDLETARVHLLSSHRVPARLEQSPGADRLQVIVQPAEMVSQREPAEYREWFLKRIHQKQFRFQPLPNVVLSIYPEKPIQTQTNFNQNLFTLELSVSGQSGQGMEEVTLEEVRELINGEQYEEASRKLQRYLEQNPDDQQAIQLQYRLERVQELMNP